VSRERLGVSREVAEVIAAGRFEVVLLKCGHWFRSHPGTFTEGTAGCSGCDGLERLTAIIDRLRAEVAA